MRKSKILLLPALLFLCSGIYAQAPNISYQSPQVYTVSTPVSPLAPKNTGGAVPQTKYGGVTTLAGNGNAGFADGPGTTAQFNAPRGLSCDAQGNIYVADRSNNRIRKVTQAGVVTTVAGSGVAGAANLMGASASFTGPNGLVVARDGTIYVADSGNQMIRMIATNGAVSTIAGTGVPGDRDGKQNATFNFPNDIVINNIGELFISDLANEQIRKIGLDGVVHTQAGASNTQLGNQDGTGPTVRFNTPGGMVADKTGDIIICDENNNTIREMLPDSIVNTIAGNSNKGFANGTATTCSFNYPAGVAIDVLGNTYVSDTFNYLIRKIDPLGNVTTLCGLQGVAGFADGQRETATFNQTFGIVTDNNGNLFVADGENNRIRQISLTGYEINKPLPPGLSFDETTGIISGTPTAASLSTDYTITAYNLQGSSSAVVNITVNALAAATVAPAISYQTPQVYAVGNAIAPLAPTNTGGAVPATIYAQVTTFAGSGAAGYADRTGTAAIFAHPSRLAEDQTTGDLYVADRDNGVIRKITPAGVVTTFATGFSQPNDVALDGLGNMYVADAASNSIKFVTASGVVTTFAGGNQGFYNGKGTLAAFYYPYGISRDAAGNLYVADSQNNAIRKIDPSANVTTFAGNGSAGNANGTGNQATFDIPSSVGIDASGNFYVSDSENNEIRKITPGAVVTTFAGTGAQGNKNGTLATATFYKPGGIAFDAAGNAYIADIYNYLIRKVDKQGNVTTLAGSGIAGSKDGVATSASFTQAYGLNYDKSGFLYVTDLGANNIRKVCLTGYAINKALPPGLSFDPTTGIITGTPTAASPPTDYTVTAYNLAGSSFTTVNIRVVYPISLAAIPDKTVCSTDFALTITGGTGDYTVTSSNANIATIVNSNIHIVAAGTVTITATDGVTTKSQQFIIDPPITPTITVNPPVNSGCDGLLFTFNASVTGEGTAPVFQWYVNGQPTGPNSSFFSSPDLKNGDLISCTLTNTTDCVTGPVTSTGATVISQLYTTPSVTIQSSASGPVALGTTIVFTATTINGGTDPIYQWMVNNVNVGTNSPTYSSACFNDGDAVTCTITNQSDPCLTALTATSKSVTVSITAGTTAISISASATTIYLGQPVTFTASAPGADNSSIYQWQVNGANVGANSPAYTANALKNGDLITCQLTDNGCSSPFTSNTIKMTVLPPLTVTIPNAFTPNGDGINDRWNIEALVSYPNCMVDIFTRYGSLIFHSTGYSLPWDGTLKGNKMPPGTYYYVIDLGNNSPKLSGYVTLIR